MFAVRILWRLLGRALEAIHPVHPTMVRAFLMIGAEMVQFPQEPSVPWIEIAKVVFVIMADALMIVKWLAASMQTRSVVMANVFLRLQMVENVHLKIMAPNVKSVKPVVMVFADDRLVSQEFFAIMVINVSVKYVRESTFLIHLILIFVVVMIITSVVKNSFVVKCIHIMLISI